MLQFHKDNVQAASTRQQRFNIVAVLLANKRMHREISRVYCIASCTLLRVYSILASWRLIDIVES
jgi:hypothetical protein